MHNGTAQRKELPTLLNVVVVREMPREVLARIEAVAPGRVRATNVSEHDNGDVDRAEILRAGHIAIVPAACHRDLRARMPDLFWVHARFVGVSELQDGDFWGTEVLLTSARGNVNSPAIAETALAGGMMLAKRLHVAARTVARTWRGGWDSYRQMQMVSGKSIDIIGLGGVGSNLARLAKGSGLRVLATRLSAVERARNIDGVDELFPPSELIEMARQSNFLAVCCASTPRTYQLVNGAVLDALPHGAILMNTARGEIIDEDELIEHLESGKLNGAYLDCYAGEQDALGPSGQPRDPNPRLAGHPNVVMTPHISGNSDLRSPQPFAFDLFIENLRLLLNAEPMINLVDWVRTY